MTVAQCEAGCRSRVIVSDRCFYEEGAVSPICQQPAWLLSWLRVSLAMSAEGGAGRQCGQRAGFPLTGRCPCIDSEVGVSRHCRCGRGVLWRDLMRRLSAVSTQRQTCSDLHIGMARWLRWL